MKKVPLSEVKDDLSRYVNQAAREDVVITRHGRPAAVLIGFKDENDWFDYRLEHDPRFLEQIARARQEIHAGLGVPFDEVREMPSIDVPRAGKAPGSVKRSRRK